MNIDHVIVGFDPTKWHGQITSSHGRDRVLWECNHNHRSSATALSCANTQLGIVEGTMTRIWNRVDD